MGEMERISRELVVRCWLQLRWVVCVMMMSCK